MGVEYRNGGFIIYLINFLAFPFYKTYKKYLWEVGDRIVEIIGIIWWWGVNNIVWIWYMFLYCCYDGNKVF